MSKDALREKIREVALDFLSEDAQAGGSRPQTFTFEGDKYGAILEPDTRQEGRLLLYVRLPERRPVDTGGIRDDVFDLMEYLESGTPIDLVPLPGYYTNERIVYKVDLDAVLSAIIR